MDQDQFREQFLTLIQAGFPHIKTYEDIKRVPQKDLRYALIYNENHWFKQNVGGYREALADIYKRAGVIVMPNGQLRYKEDMPPRKPKV